MVVLMLLVFLHSKIIVFLGTNDKLTFGDSGNELQIYQSSGSLALNISEQGPGALRVLRQSV